MSDVQQWDDEVLGEMSEQRIRAIHAPSQHFRISAHKYPPRTEHSGAMMAGTCYVLEGQCSFSFGATSVVLAKGQFAKLPEGAYRFHVVGKHEASLVMVWKLPDQYLKRLQ